MQSVRYPSSRASRRLRILLGLLVAPFTGPAAGHPAHDAAPPNIVFMLADDQSWAGTSVQPHPSVPAAGALPFNTPSLERLAAESVRFSAAYSPAPVCAPSRASILTGRNPARLGWTTVGQPRNVPSNQMLIPPASRRSLGGDDLTIASLLQDTGYRTAHYGKWHLGGGGPESHGFDTSDGDLGNEAAGQHADPNPVDIFGMADRAEGFMRAARDDGEPFFVQLSWLALHAPQNAMESTKRAYAQTPGVRGRQRNRLALTEDLDTGVGRVLDAIERLGLAENTYVVYMSDNGGDQNETAPLSGGKGSLREGGVRVPLMIRGPGIEPGSWSHVPVVGYDLFPTFAEWAGIEQPLGEGAIIDGGSLARAAANSEAEVIRPLPGLVFHFPHYQGETTPVSSFVTERFKVILDHESGEVSLFDLADDLGERHDLSAREPARAAELRRALDRALISLGAEMPTRNGANEPDPERGEAPAADRRTRTGPQRAQGQRDAGPRRRAGQPDDARRRPGARPEPEAAPAPREEPAVSVTIEGEFRVMRANGLPSHSTGTFPNRHNPHAIGAQSHEYRLPLEPVAADAPTPSAGEFGICVNGVIMDAGTGEFWTAENDRVFGARSSWNYEALGGGVNLGLDHHNAHVQRSGKYHYHGLPNGLIESRSEELGREVMIHIGWAFDGFPIYAGPGYSDPMDAESEPRPMRSSYRLKAGERPGRPEGPGGAHDGTYGADWEFVEGHGDLDVCNGRYGVTPEHPEGTYYYVVTHEFPAIPRQWKGTPDPSSIRRRPVSGPDRGTGRPATRQRSGQRQR